MKRYLLFYGSDYHPLGGMRDLHSQSDDLEELKTLPIAQRGSIYSGTVLARDCNTEYLYLVTYLGRSNCWFEYTNAPYVMIRGITHWAPIPERT